MESKLRESFLKSKEKIEKEKEVNKRDHEELMKLRHLK